MYLENKRRVYRVTSDDKRSERTLLRINGNVRIDDAACLRAENQRSSRDGWLIPSISSSRSLFPPVSHFSLPYSAAFLKRVGISEKQRSFAAATLLAIRTHRTNR